MGTLSKNSIGWNIVICASIGLMLGVTNGRFGSPDIFEISFQGVIALVFIFVGYASNRYGESTKEMIIGFSKYGITFLLMYFTGVLAL